MFDLSDHAESAGAETRARHDKPGSSVWVEPDLPENLTL